MHSHTQTYMYMYEYDSRQHLFSTKKQSMWRKVVPIEKKHCSHIHVHITHQQTHPDMYLSLYIIRGLSFVRLLLLAPLYVKNFIH